MVWQRARRSRTNRERRQEVLAERMESRLLLASVPPQPTGLEALWVGTSVIVTWTPTTSAQTYNVYRATTSGGEGSTPYATGVTAASYTDSNVTPGTTYDYEVSAVDSAGEGPRSAEVAAVDGVDVLSYHGSDLTSDGLNDQESQLTPGNVNTATFGENFTTDISDTPNLDGIPTSTLNTSIDYTAPDGQAYGEPLVKTGVTITTGQYSGTVHDVVFVATELGSLYAIDASGGNILWKDSFIYNAGGNPNPLNPTIPNGTTAIPGGYDTETNSQDVSPWICIMGTPVIDVANNSIYLITNTRYVAGGPTGDQSNPHYLYTIHKINMSNGQDTNSVFADTTLGYSNPSNPTYTYNSGPYTIGTGEGAITVDGQSRIYFNAVRQMVRPALEIYNGRVYMASASHGDNQPYHGWIITFDVDTLAINGVFNTTPNGVEGGIWSGGDGVIFDSQGYFYVETGNGTFDGNYTTTNGVTTYTGLNAQGFPDLGDYGDCFVKLELDPTTTQSSQGINGWGIKVVDYFSPYNNQQLDDGDVDLGSGGPMLLPAAAGSTAHPNLIVGAGKQGAIYLLDTSNMGKFTYNDAGAVQEIGSAINGTLSTPSYFDGRLYYSPGYGGNVVSWAISNAHIDTTSEQQTPDSIAFPGSSPYISADGTQNGIVWVIDKGTGELRAYNASNLSDELWTSALDPSRDALPGGTVKFSVATPVNGRVYALSATSLVAYGPPIPPSSAPAAPTDLTAVATGASTIVLNWVDNSNNEAGFSIERSTDGINFTPLTSVGVNVTTFTDSNLSAQTTYYYRVRAYNSYNGLSYSAYTNIASAVTATTGTQLPVNLYHFDEDGGTTTVDSVSGNNGTLIGSPLPAWVAPGQVGSSDLSFSGNGQYDQTNQPAVQVANDLSPVLGGTSSIDVWVRTTQTGSNTHWQAPAITGVEQTGGGNDINWGTLNAAGDIGIYVGDSGGIYSLKPINDGQWHNIAITRDASTGAVTLYVDGILNATGVFETGNLTSQFRLIGALQVDAADGMTQTGANYFNGQLDDLQIYGQALTQSSVIALSEAPAPPTGLTVTPASGTELDLTWTDNSTYAGGYIVQRSINNGPWAVLPELAANATSYDDTGLTPDTLYSYVVQAVDTAGRSFSNLASATTPIPPQTPTNAIATLITTTEIDLKWTNNANNATGYRILRSTIGGEFVAITNSLPPTATTYQDTGLQPGTEYDYHIQAYNVAGYSDFAGIHTGTLAMPPAGLTATGGAGQITLSWTPPAYDGDAQDLTYNIYRGTTSGGESATPIATDVSTPSFTDTLLVPGQAYYYEVTAVDLGGESARSSEASATPSSGALVDPLFESPSVGTGSFSDFVADPSGAGWTFAGSAGVAGNGSGYTSANPAAPVGTQVGYLQMANASMSQQVSLAAGTYSLSFSAAQRMWDQANQNFEVLMDGTVIGTFSPSGTNYYQYSTNAFTVTAGVHNLEFLSLDTAGGDNTALIDNVQINTIPVGQFADSGFESPSVGTGSFNDFATDPSGTGWIFAGSAGVAGNGSGYTSANPNAPQGTQVGLLQMANASISQQVSLAAGTYSVSFFAAQRMWDQANQNFEVLMDGNVIGTFSPSGTNYYQYSTNAFTVAAGAHTFEFLSLDTAGGDNTALIDNVQINSVAVGQFADSGFESPSVGTGSFNDFATDPSGTAWTFAGAAGVAGNGSGYTSANPNAPQGTQVGLLQMANSSISQQVSLASGTYQISFQAAQRMWDQANQDFELLVDGVVVSTFIPSGTSYQTYTSNSFTLSAGVHTFEFLSLDTAGGDNTALIDNVQIVSA